MEQRNGKINTSVDIALVFHTAVIAGLGLHTPVTALPSVLVAASGSVTSLRAVQGSATFGYSVGLQLVNPPPHDFKL